MDFSLDCAADEIDYSVILTKTTYLRYWLLNSKPDKLYSNIEKCDSGQ